MGLLDSILKPITGTTGSGLLKSLGTSESVRDFQHGNRLFVTNGYQLAPKRQYLYHVFFNLNTQALTYIDQKFNNVIKQIEAGMLVKAVDLPKYRLTTKTLNAYNKKEIVQSQITYEPIQITLHDDGGNVVRDLWKAYLEYYYRDTDYRVTDYTAVTKNIYAARKTDQWGYTVKNTLDTASNFFRTIQIYSLNNKQYSLYELINPKIDSFEHGRHEASQGTGVMEHTMRISYETVKYNSGYVASGNVSGFGKEHYDTQPSPLTPLGGGTKSILGPGGLIDSATNIAENISEGNFGAAALGALRASQNLKNFDFKAVATAETAGAIRGVLRNTANGPFNFPSPNNTPKVNQAEPY